MMLLDRRMMLSYILSHGREIVPNLKRRRAAERGSQVALLHEPQFKHRRLDRRRRHRLVRIRAIGEFCMSSHQHVSDGNYSAAYKDVNHRTFTKSHCAICNRVMSRELTDEMKACPASYSETEKLAAVGAIASER